MNRTEERKRKDSVRAGFTLVEIMLVIVIIGIMATAATVVIKGKSYKASCAVTRQSIGTVCTAIDMFETDCGTLPSSLDELVSDPGNSSWQGPYLRKPAQDSWGKPLQYSQDENSYRVWAVTPKGDTLESQ